MSPLSAISDNLRGSKLCLHLRCPLREQSHSPGRNLVYRSYDLDAALGHSLASFRRIEKLAHGPADVGLDGALKLLLWRKLRVDLVKTRKHILKQQLDA